MLSRPRARAVVRSEASPNVGGDVGDGQVVAAPGDLDDAPLLPVRLLLGVRREDDLVGRELA